VDSSVVSSNDAAAARSLRLYPQARGSRYTPRDWVPDRTSSLLPQCPPPRVEDVPVRS